MFDITTDIVKTLFVNENNLPALEQFMLEYFRSSLENTVNDIMAYELTAFLDYEKYARSDNANCRNGSYSRKIDTKFGSITVKIPRDRLGEFYTSFLPKYKRRDELISSPNSRHAKQLNLEVLLGGFLYGKKIKIHYRF
ncbi:hypothetical protein BO225_03655 [Dubosiella newyorkensis]|jgi:putative transposase|uniref:Mutator family transposase n=2 Tax=Dubosiella newyorkensis TaxID=1862672 RepID=A0A1U7NNT3_9FIRM|nr:transposase [Dubosiella newyorkensis]OLU47006.1 hypothetical protein BO225_03655 [Dubosiella newyorkensis]